MSFPTVLDALRQKQRLEKYTILAQASLDIEAKMPRQPETSDQGVLQDRGKALIAEIAAVAKSVDQMRVEDCQKWTETAKKYVAEATKPTRRPKNDGFGPQKEG